MLGRLGALPLDAQLFTGVTDEYFFDIVLTVFATVGHPPCWTGSGRCPSTRSCPLVSRASGTSVSSSLTLRRLATHHVGSARGVAPWRLAVRWRHGRVAYWHHPRCQFAAHYARSDYGFALRRAVVHWRHVREFFDIILIVFATVCRSLSWLAWSAAPRVLIVPSTIGRPPCWAGSGRGPSTHRYSPTLQTSSTSASSSLSR